MLFRSFIYCLSYKNLILNIELMNFYYSDLKDCAGAVSPVAFLLRLSYFIKISNAWQRLYGTWLSALTHASLRSGPLARTTSQSTPKVYAVKYTMQRSVSSWFPDCWFRKKVGTSFNQISVIFHNRIHAVIVNEFMMKIILFILFLL